MDLMLILRRMLVLVINNIAIETITTLRTTQTIILTLTIAITITIIMIMIMKITVKNT
jgi:hypothetical protein